MTDGIAVQIGLIAGVADRLRTTLETLLPQADVIIRPADAPFPRLLVADMDSTMISVECIDELADYAGIKPQIAAITERAMQGELDFAAALRERVACLAGLDEAVIDAERVLATRSDPATVLIDARAAERYEGRVEPLDPVAGHIPGALNRPWQSNLRDGRFKPAAELRAEFEALLADHAPSQVIHQCGSGVTAAHNMLAMRIAGLPGSALYAGSWSEWIRDPARPVVRGPAA